jgi:hypothetical protein
LILDYVTHSIPIEELIPKRPRTAGLPTQDSKQNYFCSKSVKVRNIKTAGIFFAELSNTGPKYLAEDEAPPAATVSCNPRRYQGKEQRFALEIVLGSKKPCVSQVARCSRTSRVDEKQAFIYTTLTIYTPPAKPCS